MRFTAFFATLILAPCPIFAQQQNQDPNQDQQSSQSQDDQNHSSTITSSASLACPAGDTQSKYESCSSSVSSKIDECNDSDLGCACTLANSGFKYVLPTLRTDSIPQNLHCFVYPGAPLFNGQNNMDSATSTTVTTSGGSASGSGTTTMSAPSQKEVVGASGTMKGDDDALRVFLAVGVAITIAVGALAAI